MFRWWSGQTMAGHKVNHLPKTWGDWWNLTVGPGHRDRQDVIVSYAPVQVTAPRQKKGQGSGNMWTLRRTAKVLNLSHFSWLDSSQAEGKGLRQPTFPKLMYQQNGLSLSLFSGSQTENLWPPHCFTWSSTGKGEERLLDYLELLTLS